VTHVDAVQYTCGSTLNRFRDTANYLSKIVANSFYSTALMVTRLNL